MKRIIFSILGLWALSPVVLGQRTLTIDDCRQLALDQNKQRAIAAQTEQKAGYVVKSMRANFLPKFSATGLYAHSNVKSDYTIPGGYLPTFVPDASGNLQPNLAGVVDGNPVFNQYAFFPDVNLNMKVGSVYLASAKVEQPLFMGGKIVAGYRMARLGQELAQLNQRLSESEVRVKSDQAFWDCVRAKELLGTAEVYQKTVEEFLRNVQNAQTVGMTSRNEELKVQTKFNEAKLNVLKGQNALRLATMNLCYVTGLPLTEKVEVVVPPEEAQVWSTEVQDISNRPEYLMLEKQVELKAQEVKVTRADFLPNVGLAATYGYMNGVKLNGNKLLDGASFAGLMTVNIPLFHWGEGYNKVRAAQADATIARLQQEDVNSQLLLEVTLAVNQVQEAQLELELARNACKQAEENLKVMRNHYEAGMGTTAELLEAQTEWQKALAEEVEARALLRLGWVRYQKAIGQ